MKTLFADTHYWIAIIDARDPWHDYACLVAQEHGADRLVTTDEVLVKVLNAMSARGKFLREAAVKLAYRLRRDPVVLVVAQSRESFDYGLIVYDSRHDKGYSLVDCISMNTMRRLEITQVLTHDRHFVQEGFEVLIS